ncbi:MAG: cytochrome b N-terminal domain-containing protein [Cyanobacteria bacterium J06638_28]
MSNFVSTFPTVWNDYQHWLRDIVSARPVLQQRYSPWRANLIFRWRLLYFFVYVSTVIVATQVWAKLKGIKISPYKLEIAPEGESTPSHLPSLAAGPRFLQRVATLLAVAELTLCGLAALTGVLIAFYYQPTAVGAHRSLTAIAHDIPSGSLILSLHNIAGNGLIVLALVQIVVMFLGRQFLLPWLLSWFSGILLTLSAIGLSWTAIVLNWNQIGFWRFKLELSIVGSIPWVGSMLREILSGGSGISSITLQHMYALHSYVLAIAAVLLSMSHLTALVLQEQIWKSAER